MAQESFYETVNDTHDNTRVDVIAGVLSVIWLCAVGGFFWAFQPVWKTDEGLNSAQLAVVILAVLLPIAVIWIGAFAVRSARSFQSEVFRLQSGLDALRQTVLAQRAAISVPNRQTAQPTENHAKADHPTDDDRPRRRGANFTSRREISKLIVPEGAAPKPSTDQPSLALGTTPEDFDPPLERPDLVHALNFPDNENDVDGFAALRRALRDRNSRKLVQASQDALTLLSQDGIYMDDLEPTPTSAGLWRRFANGERGASMDGLGAIRESVPLMLATGRMREDTIFRDVVHHFLRRFDQMLVTFEEHATDTDLLELAETRTARAFMLLGRATGTFD